MPTRQAHRWGFPGGVAVVAALLCWSCGGSSTPSPPGGGTASGTVPVRGTERLYWDQVGAVADLTFRAYVDGQPVPLAAATCDAAQAGPQGAPCVSPLPPLTVGVHTISLTAVSRASGLESAQSPPVTVQRLAGLAASGAAVSAPASPARAPSPAADLAIPETVATADGSIFDVDVLARGLDAPTQLALAPDGRLFVAERTARVLVVGPLEGADVALDPAVLFDPPPATPAGFALHPDFARNRLAYLAYAVTDSRGEAHLRIVRLREAGGTLGDPATLLNTTLTRLPPAGPRLAFGPDGLLYVSLAQAVPLPLSGRASTEGGAILRVSDEGRPAAGGLVFAWGGQRPLALAWHPFTRDPWVVLGNPDGPATLRLLGSGADYRAPAAKDSMPATEVGTSRTPGGLVFLANPADSARPAALVALPENDALLRVTNGRASAAEPLLGAIPGRVGDILAGPRGTVYLTTHNRDAGLHPTPGTGLVARLTLRPR